MRMAVRPSNSRVTARHQRLGHGVEARGRFVQNDDALDF